jgi:lipid II:glycine glycyltransferase (peptidoglycan interpeptide bridge formation enzyme)
MRHADPESIRLWLARVEGTLAAGVLCFYGRGEVFYWSGAMHKEFAQRRPNNLIHWRIIADATDRGYQVYNMGASGHLAGVREFKERFRAQPVSYPIYLVANHLYLAGSRLQSLAQRAWFNIRRR